jgi:DNA-binding MarR family transcriptional regulator
LAEIAGRQTPAPTQAEYKVAAELREALRHFARRTELAARDQGLTARSYQLLLMIKTGRDQPGSAGLSELEDRLQLGKSTITELVLRAEAAGLVVRELDKTRRRGIVVRLTRTGEKRLADALATLGDERQRLRRILAGKGDQGR